ncbi:MAG: cellulase family glycosylhydrolase [Mycobacteriales bacterium]
MPVLRILVACCLTVGASMTVGAAGTSAAGTSATGTTATGTTATYPSAAAPAASFHGVNWADPRDNFVTGNVVPTGLSDTDGPARSAAKARQIVAGLQHNLGANTIRLPVNPATVSGDWWRSYAAVIETATRMDVRVILSYWEADSSKDGRIDDLPQWSTMWNHLTSSFGGNPQVYFEPMNEPHGYSYDAWSGICAQWLRDHSDIPRGRVIVSGVGYNTDLSQLGTDARLAGTLFSVHDYTWFNPGAVTVADFTAGIAKEVGPYAGRTIIDEFGAPMTDGTDYNADPSTSTNIAFIDAIARYAHDNHVGTVYWPGLRAGDGYRMEDIVGVYPHLSLADTNASGRAKLLESWGR